MSILVQLDVAPGPYRGGQTVAGNVILVNNTGVIKPFREGIKVTFWGGAWTDFSLQDVRHRGREVYLNEKVVLTPPINAVGTRSIFPGKTELPFQFRLPADLPSSFYSLHGGVRYTVDVTLGKEWSSKKKDIQVQGTSSNQDNNNPPGHFMKVYDSKGSRPGKIKATLRTEKTGFVPGEDINFQLEIENSTQMNLPKIGVNLVQEVTYIAPNATRQKRRKVLKLKCSEVLAGQPLIYFGRLTMPKRLAPTNLGNCRIIRPTYYLQLKIKLPVLCWAFTLLKGAIPIQLNIIPAASPAPDIPPRTSNTRQRQNWRGDAAAASGQNYLDEVVDAQLAQLFFDTAIPNPSRPQATQNQTQANHTRNNPIDDLPPSYEEAMRLT